MEIRTLEDMLNAQATFLQQVQHQMTQLSYPQAQSVEDSLQNRQALLTYHQQQLEVINQAKEVANQRYDEEIRKHTEAIAQLVSHLS